jgi:hypothetical protein
MTWLLGYFKKHATTLHIAVTRGEMSRDQNKGAVNLAAVKSQIMTATHWMTPSRNTAIASVTKL